MIDFLIVGQGLAGTVLALQLLEQGQRIVVVDAPAQNQASRVAAGMYNPIVGSKLTKTWLAEALFPCLTRFYAAAERTLGASFLHPKPIYRPFVTAQERTLWLDGAADYAPFVEAVTDADYHSATMVHHHGGLLLRQTGYVDVPRLLLAARHYLQARGAYIQAAFHYAHVQPQPPICYHGLQAHKIIFCEGAQALMNPYFRQLPLRPVKGEWLSVALQQPLDVIYNRGVFVLPHTTPHRAIVGATYDRQNLSATPTAAGRQALTARLHQHFRLRHRILDQRAGIRPATADHRPLVGLHPRYPHLGIFNGLGSKGVSLAPYWAAALVQHLLHQQPLPPEVVARRGIEPLPPG